MKWLCGDADVPAPCNPWGGVFGGDLSFAMPNSCSACRDDDPKKLSLTQQSDVVSSAGRQPWSNVVGLVWHLRDGEDHIGNVFKISEMCLETKHNTPYKTSFKKDVWNPVHKKRWTRLGFVLAQKTNLKSDALIGRFPELGRSDWAEI